MHPLPEISPPARACGPPRLHPDLEELRAFLGVWEGAGEGHYPTIRSFHYLERVAFDHVGKPFLAYGQGTRTVDDGRPLHTESGFLRPGGAGRAEFLIAQPTGIVEVYEGPFDGRTLDVRAAAIGLSRTAKRVRSLRRRFELDDDMLRYDLWMAYADTPETHHLHAELRRIDSASTLGATR
ncbi:MAG: FABP family protein [Actinomycetota bacterium]|nr:FABP family protein [Actinomycetota bacterium]